MKNTVKISAQTSPGGVGETPGPPPDTGNSSAQFDQLLAETSRALTLGLTKFLYAAVREEAAVAAKFRQEILKALAPSMLQSLLGPALALDMATGKAAIQDDDFVLLVGYLCDALSGFSGPGGDDPPEMPPKDPMV